MRWQSLPPELLVHVLVHLTLPRLRLVKAVSRATANACRRALRSDEWRSNKNLDAMDAELKTKIDYKLPMTVCFFPNTLNKHKCLATIYELKLLRTDSDGAYIDLRKRRNWCDNQDDDSTQTWVGAMCIEVHGEGIAGSEHALRTMIQSVLRERGECQYADELADTLTPHYDKFGGLKEQMPLQELLECICPVSEVQKGRWKVHDSPSHQDFMSVWEMCAMGLDLFV